MKNFHKVVFVKILFLGFFLVYGITGCTNIVADATYSDGYVATNSDDGNHLKVYATTTNNSIDFSQNSNSKTILPNDALAGQLYFYLWGKNRITRETLTLRQVSFVQTESRSTGYVDFVFTDSTSYEMTLVCTKEKVNLVSDNSTNILEVTKKACFAGFASVDLRFADHVLFYLSPYHATGYGSVQLKLYIPWTIPAGYTLKLGLYDINTNQVIKMNDIDRRPTETTMFYSDLQGSVPPATPNYNLDNVTPGIYNFKVTFGGKIDYIFSEDIIVLPNQCTAETRAIPEVIERIPNAAPSNFIAGFKDPEDGNSNCYSVEFMWDDNSVNENHFELEMLDVTNANTTTYTSYIKNILDNSVSATLKDGYWDSVLSATGVTKEIYNPDYYGDSSKEGFQTINTAGALLSNNTYIDLNMPLGKRYIARICAVNNAGKTSYSYVSLSDLSAKTKLNSGYNIWDNGATSINRYVMAYNLQGGRYKDSGTDVTGKIGIYKYNSQVEGSSSQIINPAGVAGNGYEYETGKYAKLVIGAAGVEWTKWQLSGIGGTDVTDYTYSDYKNVTYYAYYDGITTAELPEITAKSNTEDPTGGLSTIQVFGANNTSVYMNGITAPNRLDVTGGNYFTIKRSDFSHIWFTLYNPISESKFIFSSTSMTALRNYGQTTVLKIGETDSNNIYTAARNNFNFNYYDCYTIDISDENNYKKGNSYYVLFTFYPTNNEENPISYFLNFKITD